MNGEYFFAQDHAGNMQKVHVSRHASPGDPAPRVQQEDTLSGSSSATYALEDGSPVKRIDSDTFLVLGTGAYVTLIRE